MLINKEIAHEHGVRMGDDFLNKLKEPLALKEFIQNTSRIEHGKRVFIPKNLYKESRSLTLTFCIFGKDAKDFDKNRQWLYEELYKGRVDIKVPIINGEPTFRLIYTGKNISYGEDLSHTSCRLTVGFEEPNPEDRGEKALGEAEEV